MTLCEPTIFALTAFIGTEFTSLVKLEAKAAVD